MLPISATLDPLIATTASVALIWLVLTAITTPGTGIPELGSLILLIVVALTISSVPQPAALLLLLAALGCFIALLRYRHRWYLPLIGFTLQLLGTAALLNFSLGALPLLILINIFSIAYYLLIILPGLKIQTLPDAVGADTLIGTHGIVIRTLDPLGSIKIDGAVWRARADHLIPSGTTVRVLSRDGLELHVTPSDPPR